MQRYENVSGHSGVVAFELQPNAIIVQFQDGWKYRYTTVSTGPSAIREMKQYAQAGWGLSTYISQHVKNAYAEKFR